ncbi:PKHD-type hydroxylase [Dyella jiangningensis]|uniref:Fe2+-dependent dioxygenase n=2 Tax=Gammaproteobacteria TaxID=1236 RepID=UPI00088831D5|nr:Fe2+-dependent dioxygenase [Dyella sp. AtDHG13]PXV61420.1 PKHD-type hydroxylase [Dyella sp. AtDHG13]SDJ90698.1 PKHD-type hydroxylase [Dyella jiangningensis]
MLLHVPEVLNADEVALCRRRLAQAPWDGGRVTSARARHHLQLPEDCSEASELGVLIQAALARNTTFFAGALPRHIFPPLFHRYGVGPSLGLHVDNAVRRDRRNGENVALRTDLSATLFLSEPGEYDGGELVIEDTYGEHSVKLAAGDLILYPASSLHRVEPVTRGERLAASFWIQSLVRDEAHRRLLLELDVSIQSLGQANAPQADVLRLTGVYHNLLRTWSET